MKKLIALAGILILGSCASTSKTDAKKPLYEVLTSKPTGGANIRFYEIVSTSDEMKMLLGDENLHNKINPEDIKTASFIILSMGEKTSGGYSISVDNVEETADKIIVTVKETGPKPGEMATSMISYPYAIVKINSKKEIEVK